MLITRCGSGAIVPRPDYIEVLAQALLPFAKPEWPMRWGWTELPADAKTDMRALALNVAAGLGHAAAE